MFYNDFLGRTSGDDGQVLLPEVIRYVCRLLAIFMRIVGYVRGHYVHGLFFLSCGARSLALREIYIGGLVAAAYANEGQGRGVQFSGDGRFASYVHANA